MNKDAFIFYFKLAEQSGSMLDFDPFIGTLTRTFLREWVKIYVYF